jgi:hypothetical protein
MADIYHKVGNQFRLTFTYFGVTGLTDGSFTKEVSKNGATGSSTGITVSEISAGSNAGEYAVTIDGTTGFVSQTGTYTLVIYRTSIPADRWSATLRVTSDGTGYGTIGAAIFTATANNGRVTDGSNPLNGVTVRVTSGTTVIAQLTSDANGLWGPVYLDNGTYNIYSNKSSYAQGVAQLVVSGGVATGPGSDVVMAPAATAGTITAAQLWSYARRMALDKVGTKADAEIKQAVQEALNMLATAHCWQRFDTLGRINLKGNYTAGTVAVTNGGSALVLTGGTWPSWAGSGEVLINNQWHDIASRTNGTTLVLSQPYDGSTASGLSYTLVQYRYALPSDCLRVEDVFLGQSWPWGQTPISSIALEATRRSWVNYSSTTGPAYWSVTNDEFAVWPTETSDRMVNIRYRRRPADLAIETDLADWDANLIELLRRAIDYQIASRTECAAGNRGDCYQAYQEAMSRALGNEKSNEDRPLWNRGAGPTMPYGFEGAVS